jgi:hypothetical protein
VNAARLVLRALGRLAARLGIHVRAACACPLCDKAERDARQALGMPARHPERITSGLSGGREKWLAAVAADLWPHDEYAEIVIETRKEDL